MEVAKSRRSPRPRTPRGTRPLQIDTKHANNTDGNGYLKPKEEPTPSEMESQPLLPNRTRSPALDSRSAKTGAEYSVETRTKYTYLGCYFLLNLTLTIYNKALLQGVTFPWLLTTLHASCASIGCYVLLLQGHFKLTKLGNKENLTLIAFSFLFTTNIAISNVSLAAVSVPFHQIMRSLCPAFTVVIYRTLYNRVYSRETYLSIIPIIIGVSLATYGDYYFTFTGFVLTLLGVVLASVKTVASNRLMTGSLALPALEILLRMSPLAAIQSGLYSLLTGEVSKFLTFAAEGNFPFSMYLALLGNGVLAFVLNVSSFQTNKLAGALTLTVAGNLKQCLTVALGIVLFNVEVGPLNGFGMVVTMIGAAIYSKVELNSKGHKDDGRKEYEKPNPAFSRFRVFSAT